jgi:peptidoglycan-N-acetylglucosamine deacetylase
LSIIKIIRYKTNSYFQNACIFAAKYFFMNFKKLVTLSVWFSIFLACSNQPSPSALHSAQNTIQDSVVSKKQAVVAEHRLEVELDTPKGDIAPRIYLTIDDGPSPYSADILEVANEKNVKLTVFLVGNNLWSKKYREFLNQYRNNPFIELANHSYSHAKGKYALYYKNPNGVLLDFYKNIVQMQLPNNLARLPGRSFWALGNKEQINQESGKHAARLLRLKGFNLFGWDVEWFYHHKTGAPLGSAESVFAEIQRSLKKNETFTKGHCVVLLHERHFQSKYEIAKLITLCQKEGYVLEHLKQYPIPKSDNNVLMVKS